MGMHRTAQRLRVLSPALQGQNKLQQNNSQDLSLTDFEGSRFDRWLRQGSGQHPLTGSPQHQWGFSFTQWPGDRLTACCSGALAVLCGCGEVRLSCPGHPYHQGRHQGRGLGAFRAAAMLMASSLSICWSFSVICCFRNSTRDASLSGGGLMVSRTLSGTVIYHLLSTFLPVSNPLAKRLRTVLGEIPKAIAASLISNSIFRTVTHAVNRMPYLRNRGLASFGGSGGGAAALVGRAVARW